MIKIRSNVFETNSSSTHSLCIETDYKKDLYVKIFQKIQLLQFLLDIMNNLRTMVLMKQNGKN